jgi:hypothetical protein
MLHVSSPRAFKRAPNLQQNALFHSTLSLLNDDAETAMANGAVHAGLFGAQQILQSQVPLSGKATLTVPDEI